MSSPFIITSWQNSFLDLLLDTMLEGQTPSADRDFSRLTFIFPHNRPQMYLFERIKQDPHIAKPCILPQCISAQNLFPAFRQNLFPQVDKTAKQLDMVALLLDCVRQLPNSRELLVPSSPEHDETLLFLPWGIRLANLFEECFTHAVEPENFLYEEYRVTRYAAKLLEHIGTLFSLYKLKLEEKKWTTPGYDAYKVIQYLDEHNSLPETALWNVLQYKPGSEYHIIIAGFFTLNGAEEALFHYLWEHCNAQILLQADTEATPHWSCQPVFDWKKRWGALAQLIPSQLEMPPFENLRYVAGFDLHSQLGKVRNILESTSLPAPSLSAENCNILPEEQFPQKDAPSATPSGERPEPDTPGTLAPAQHYAADTAIVLPDTGLLMPALHHLPYKNINISMGYPLNRSSLFDLLDTIIQLQKNKQHGQYYWRDIVNLIRHPYIKMLQSSHPATQESGEPGLSLRKTLHIFEDALRKSNQVYINLRDFFTTLYYGSPEIQQNYNEVSSLLLRLERTVLRNFSVAGSPYEIAQALHHFCKLLLRYGKQLWKQFPIDAECLFRLHSTIIPELSTTELAREKLPQDILYSLVHTLIESKRVPFEATPLVGLQVLGLLETRLLRFRRVIIPECTEDLLPGVSLDDPLLPDPLRLEIGLPSKRKREEIVAYHFFRLLACAEEIVLMWQENNETGGLLDGRKRKSRFIEELLWNYEKKQGKLLSAADPASPQETLSIKINPIVTKRTAIDNTQEIHNAVLKFLSKPLSATALDCYLTCPAKFTQQYILRILPASEVTEGQDLPKIGNAIHKTLLDFYTPRLGKQLPEGNALFEQSFAELLHIFHNTEEYKEIQTVFPADVYTLFYTSGEIRLRNYLLNQPSTMVLALETALLPAQGILHEESDCHIRLYGRADRIDLREGNIHILDYKTGGNLPQIRASLWENSDLWDQAASWSSGSPVDPYKEISGLLPSIQLPFYLSLFSRLSLQETKIVYKTVPQAITGQNDGIQGITAAWVAMGSDGGEKSLFTNVENYEYATRSTIDKINALLSFLTKHMLQTPVFEPNEGNHCKWCPYAGRCVALE